MIPFKDPRGIVIPSQDFDIASIVQIRNGPSMLFIEDDITVIPSVNQQRACYDGSPITIIALALHYLVNGWNRFKSKMGFIAQISNIWDFAINEFLYFLKFIFD